MSKNILTTKFRFRLKCSPLANFISYETKINRNRGEGEGKSYKPWYKVGEKTSHTTSGGQKNRGNGHRIKGLKTKRVHHLLSNYERMVFIVLDLNPKIVDIREQYPLLDIDLAKRISTELGITYPSYSNNHVLTSDFFVDFKDGRQEALTVKPVSNISPRQLELFQIEKTYWQRKGISWKLMTERNIPKDQILLVNYLDIYTTISSFHNKDFSIRDVSDFYSYMLINGGEKNNHGLVDFCNEADLKLKCEEGLSLRILKVMLGKQIVQADWKDDLFSNTVKMSELKIIKDVNIDKSTLAA